MKRATIAVIGLMIAMSSPAYAQQFAEIISAADCTTTACSQSYQTCRSNQTFYLCNTGTGFYSIAVASTLPAGSNTQVQFNNSGVFGGDPGLTYIASTDALTVSGSVASASWLSTNADSVMKFPFTSRYAGSVLTPGPAFGNGLMSQVIAGAIANPTAAPSLASINGFMPLDTYRIKYSWRGRYADVANGSTNNTVKINATTLESPEAVIVVSTTSNDGITVTLPAYPDNATATYIWCNRDGDAIVEDRLCGTVTYPSTSINLFSFAPPSGGPPTTNNTVDRTVFAVRPQGWIDSNGIGGTPNVPLSVNFNAPFTSEATWKVGRSIFASHDNANSLLAYREAQYEIPICGTSNFQPQQALDFLDGVNGPLPSSTNRVALRMMGPCNSVSVTWKSYVDLRGFASLQHSGFSGTSSNLSVSVTGVTDANFVDVPGISVYGDGASRIRVLNSSLGWSGSMLTNCNDCVFDGVSTYQGPHAYTCAALLFSGGSYVVRNSDFSCPVSAALVAPITIGNETGTGTATPVTHVVIANNTMRPSANTSATYYNFLRAFFDDTAVPSTLILTGNSIYLDNGSMTQCVGTAPAQGSLIAINSGASTPGNGGKVNVYSSGNTLWFRSCEKGIVWRVSELDPSSSLISVGDNMYVETTGVGSSGVDEDTHCYEGGYQNGNLTVFQGGSCVAVNNANGETRPFYVHGGCCAAFENPQIYIENYYIEARSTSTSPSSGFAIGNSCDYVSGCDFWVNDVTIRKNMASLAAWNDLFLDSTANPGSSLNVRDSDYDTADVSGTIRVMRSLLPQATAPAICTVGDEYKNTDGSQYLCTATNVWTKTTRDSDWPGAVAVLTNKTFDANDAGNVFKRRQPFNFTAPGAFLESWNSGSADSTAARDAENIFVLMSNNTGEYAEWNYAVLPADFDNTQSLSLRLTARKDIAGAVTDDFCFDVQFCGTAGTEAECTLGGATEINFTDVPADTNIRQATASGVPAASLAPNDVLRIRVTLDNGNSACAQDVAARFLNLVVEYGVSQ